MSSTGFCSPRCLVILFVAFCIHAQAQESGVAAAVQPFIKEGDSTFAQGTM